MNAGYVLCFLNKKKITTLPWKCIVGCIFNFVGLIIIGEIPCIYIYLKHVFQLKSKSRSLFYGKKNNSNTLQTTRIIHHYNGAYLSLYYICPLHIN
jgi:hypothetical protein